MSTSTDIHAKLPDNTTGAITPKTMRETFDLLKPDTLAHMDDISSVGGLAQFDYKLKVGAVDATPVSGKISFDNADPSKATKLYINKQDRRHTDMSLFLAGINTGDYFNIHDNNNVNDFVAFDVIGKSVQTGDIFMVPVKFYDNNGTLTDKERVFVHWQRDMAIPNNLVIGDRTGEAQVTLDAKAGDASHVVFKRDGVAKSSMGVIASNNDELIIEQRANDDVRFIIPAGNTIVAKIGTEFKTVAFTDSLPVAKTITDVAEIDATGVYDGTDIAQAPITGDVIIEAYKDAKGDFDLSCKGADMRRYEGGKQKGTSGAIHWGTVAPDHLFGTTVPADTLGQDGDIYFKVK